jgi:hypothetical protein
VQIRLIVSVRCTDVAPPPAPRRRQRRREKLQRHAIASPKGTGEPPPIIREAVRVERLAYTRSQAAEALGISRSTLNRLLPFLETVDLPWGTKLIPVDELERLLEERRRSARGDGSPRPAAGPGRFRPSSSNGSAPSAPPARALLGSPLS